MPSMDVERVAGSARETFPGWPEPPAPEVVSRLDRQPPHTVLAALLQGQLVFAMRHGIAPEQLCRLAQVPESELVERDRHVPYSWLVAFWRTLIERLPQRDLGMELGLFWTFDRVGPMGEMLRHSPTFLELLHKSARLSHFLDSARQQTPLQLELRDQHVHYVLPEAVPHDLPERTEELAFATVAQLRALSGERICPRTAHFARSRERLRNRYQQYLGCEITFGHAPTTLVFERATLERPVPGAVPEASAHYEAYLRRTAARGVEPEVVHEVRRAIAHKLATGALSQAVTARALGLSVRSLQRKLDDAGVSYRELVDAQRKAAALRLISAPGSTVSEVAFATGYVDVSSFVRAFRRWTGYNPSGYRKRPALCG
jgi:AraC-like DNA-binding protein